MIHMALKKITPLKDKKLPFHFGDIQKELQSRISSYANKTQSVEIGTITEVTDGVVKIAGLPNVSYMEMVLFSNGEMGVAINLESDSVGAVVLGEYLDLKEGDEVTRTGKLLSIGVGDNLIGRVVDPLGKQLDGKGELVFKKTNPIEKIAPGVVARQSVDTPLQTGIKAIDSMIPIGRGQRQLIIGDRGTGKTAIALDAIINQKGQNVVCIYVAIGQKRGRIAQVTGAFDKYNAFEHTIIVSASASDSSALQYIAPYSGCAIAEYFLEKGRDVLLVFDDLSKHAWAYRQISLILKRPSGREAYPGDVFYLHSRLLERACRLSKEYGGGSITALPIIETQAGDISAYIPTNVISITDGQIFLESDLFYAGQRPAINVGNSVSRVGGAAQIKAMKQVAGKLRLDLAQYRALAAFAQFAQDLDDATKQQIERGARMVELLKQVQFEPLSVAEQVAIIWAGTTGELDSIPVSKVSEFEIRFMQSLREKNIKILKLIGEKKALDEEIEKSLKKLATEIKESLGENE